RHALDFIPEDERELIAARIQEVFEKGYASVEGHLLAKSGNKTPYWYTGTRVEIGGEVFLSGMGLDITERREFEAAQREQLLFLSTLINAMPYPIFFKDSSLRYQGCNDQFAAFLGREKREILGKTVFELAPEHLANTYHASDLELLESGDVQIYESQVEDREGNRRNVLFHKATFSSNSGKDTGIVGAILDITERKMLEEELIHQKERAEAADRAKSKFLATMSHEIRTPLNTIIGIGDMMAEAVTAPEQQHYISAHNRASESLLALINDILDLSKIEAGQMVLEPVSFDLGELIEATLDILSITAQDKGIDLLHTIDPETPLRIEADAQRLRQILLNLIGNAVKFTPQGRVEVRVGLSEDGQQHHFTISDTGIGISLDKLEHIFKPFTQADDTRTRLFGGTGLGLSICRRLVTAMGGRIWAESVVNAGSRFLFTLPLKRVEKVDGAALQPVVRQTKRHQPKTHARGDQGYHILLVEDAVDNQLVVQAFLKNSPYRVSIANNGAEAVDAYAPGRFDLILMDVQMPVMDGIAATRAIRIQESDSGAERVPIIAFTAHAMGEDTRRIMDAGCDLHLSKPVRKQRLLDVLASSCRSSFEVVS
ncbi:MAG: response regulator, partial [Magnetococcales bacterium]|nr:response regulator [Magnetococcales bacterium]